MKCEYCTGDHDGSYGSGRFCNPGCARGFSTKNKRREISKKVSDKLTANGLWQECPQCLDTFFYIESNLENCHIELV